MVPDTPDVEQALFGPDGVAEGLTPGKIVVDMSSISPIATKEFARRSQRARLRLSGRAGVGRRGRREGRDADDHGRRPGSGVRQGQADLRTDGQEHQSGRRERRRADHQGRQSDHRRSDDRGRRRSAALRLEGRRGSGARPSGADGRLRFVAHSRSPRRAHGQTQLRSRLPHRVASEGSEPRLARRAKPRRQPAEHCDLPGTVQRRGRRRRRGLGPLRHGSGPGAARPPRNRRDGGAGG